MEFSNRELELLYNSINTKMLRIAIRKGWKNGNGWEMEAWEELAKLQSKVYHEQLKRKKTKAAEDITQ